MMRSPKRHRITKEDSGENSLTAYTTGPTAPSSGGRSNELTANPSRRHENEGITFTGRSHTSPKLIANSFNRQFTTSKLGKHSSSRRSRHVSKDVKRMSLEQAESFTRDQLTSAIKSCWSSRAYGHDTLPIFHLKNLGPLATKHLTTLYNVSSCIYHLRSRRFLHRHPLQGVLYFSMGDSDYGVMTGRYLASVVIV